MAEVPADLVEWFKGEKVAANRHGLRRFQTWWRVMSVLGVLGDTETFGDVYVAEADLREFKTELGAYNYAKSLEAKGRTVLTQTGITIWLDADELPSAGISRDDHTDAAADPTAPPLVG